MSYADKHSSLSHPVVNYICKNFFIKGHCFGVLMQSREILTKEDWLKRKARYGWPPH